MNREDGSQIKFLYFMERSFCIYGAGIVAAGIYTAVKTLYRKTPLFFLVSDAAEGGKDENPAEIDGIPVKRLSQWRRELQDIQKDTDKSRLAVCPEYYFVTAPETHHPAIVESLHSIRVDDEHICLLTGEQENELLEAYYGGLGNCVTVRRLLAQEKRAESFECPSPVSVRVFQAKCHVDRPLRSLINPPSYVCPIQVGAELTDQKICALCDNTGNNISTRNRNYCELTATYHAWKNSREYYKGLCHYRRIFDIDDGQMRKLLERNDDWDVILPYPSVHYPDISVQHIRYVCDADWNAMLRALEETAPDYYEAYLRLIESGEQYFFNYNMLIARAEVFDDYCNFLFSVLEKTETLTTPRGWERADRFAGYMGENLTTLYFLKNRDKWKMVYAGKRWLI